MLKLLSFKTFKKLIRENNTEQDILDGPPIKDLLFKPLIFTSSCGDKQISFESLYIPFSVKKDGVFLLCSMDGCGINETYIQFRECDPKKPTSAYRDAARILADCLEEQERIGVSYYFGKLDKMVRNYTDGLQTLTDKGYLTPEEAEKHLRRAGIKTPGNR